jgi:hypothetical protein
MKIVHIQWVDSTSWEKWHSLPIQDTKHCVIDSVGYLIDEKKDRVVIAGSLSDCGNADMVMAIPKGAIFKMKTIKIGAK